MKTPTPQPKWLPSGRAAAHIGLSKATLRRLVDQGVLVEGQHFRRGLLTPTSPWYWEVHSCTDAIEKLAAMPRRPYQGEPGPLPVVLTEGGQTDG